MSGRKAEAARNDTRILEAARAVFIEDPSAPISAVAERAGVGISGLYRRYASKEDLLRHLAAEGLRLYISVAEESLAGTDDPWVAFRTFMTRIVEADTHSLTQRLAGTFTPTEDLVRDSLRGQELNETLFDRAQAAGALRPDLSVNDLSVIFEQISNVRLGDAERTAQLRHRYLTLMLDAMHAPTGDPLPGPPPTWEEIAARWEVS